MAKLCIVVVAAQSVVRGIATDVVRGVPPQHLAIAPYLHEVPAPIPVSSSPPPLRPSAQRRVCCDLTNTAISVQRGSFEKYVKSQRVKNVLVGESEELPAGVLAGARASSLAAELELNNKNVRSRIFFKFE